jgi:hypothetical protein
VTGNRARSASSPVTYLRLYVDDDGESHFEQRAFGGASDTTVAGQGLLDEGEASRYRLRLVPPGWVRDWGPSKERTLAAYLSGEGTVEASDGDRRRVGPGVMLLAEDTTGRGHRAQVAGGAPLMVMHILLPVPDPT